MTGYYNATLQFEDDEPVEGKLEVSREEAGDTVTLSFTSDDGNLLAIDLDLVNARFLHLDLGRLAGPGARGLRDTGRLING